jgi:hypothetical protein
MSEVLPERVGSHGRETDMSAQVEPLDTSATPTATIIDSQAAAAVLAGHLLDPGRSRPVVVITIAAGQIRPYIDADEIHGAVSGLADVYVLPTGSITFAMSDRLPKKTQVYGGAGRVYPVDRTWLGNPYAAPLRFAFGPSQGSSAKDKLIADALGAVNTADLVTRRDGPSVVQVEGYVKSLIGPSRAWVRTDDGRNAAIWQDLLFPGLPIDRTLRVGMRISGAMDVEAHRLDVAATIRTPAEALNDYAVGDVVLCRVVKLDEISACVELYPGARTEMSAKEVTGNGEDRLTAVMSLAEVLPARVITRGGHDGRGWRLSTFDVEDSEEILESPSLLPGGPSWLVMAEPGSETSTALLEMSTPGLRDDPAELKEGAALTGLAELTELPAESLTELPEESPAIEQPAQHGGLLSLVPEPAPQEPSPIGADEMESLRGEIRELEKLLLRARTLENAFQFERDGFREQASESHARVQQLVRSAESARTDLRIEKQKSQRLEKQARSVKAQASKPYDPEVPLLDPVSQFQI